MEIADECSGFFFYGRPPLKNEVAYEFMNQSTRIPKTCGGRFSMRYTKNRWTKGFASLIIACVIATPAYANDPTPTSLSTADADTLRVMAGVTPDQWSYSMERIGEKIQFTFTWSTEEEAKLFAEWAKERLAEAEWMKRQNDAEWVADLLKEYQTSIKEAQIKIAEAQAQLANDEEDAEGEKVSPGIGHIVRELAKTQQVSNATLQELVKVVPQDTQSEIAVQNDAMSIQLGVWEQFITAKQNFKEAKAAVKAARAELNAARKQGNAELLALAEKKWSEAKAQALAAEAQKDLAEELKEEWEEAFEDSELEGEAALALLAQWKAIHEAEENMEESDDEDSDSDSDSDGAEEELMDEDDQDEESDEEGIKAAEKALDKAEKNAEKAAAKAQKALEKAKSKLAKAEQKARGKGKSDQDDEDEDEEKDEDEDE
jgi:hypothetical protein